MFLILILIFVVAIFGAFSFFSKPKKTDGKPSVAIRLIVGVPLGLYICASLAGIWDYKRSLCLYSIIFIVIGISVMRKMQPRKFYLSFLFKIYFIMLVVTLIYAFKNMLSDGMALATPYLAFSFAVIAGAIIFPINRWLFFYKFKKEDAEAIISGESESITIAALMKKMTCPIKKAAFFLELINTLAKNERILAVRIKEDNYLLHNSYFLPLTDEVETYILNNGSRDILQIQENVTKDSARGLFLLKALGKLVSSEKVKETSIGKDPEDPNSKEQFIYSHANRPMISREIDLDDDDDE